MTRKAGAFTILYCKMENHSRYFRRVEQMNYLINLHSTRRVVKSATLNTFRGLGSFRIWNECANTNRAFMHTRPAEYWQILGEGVIIGRHANLNYNHLTCIPWLQTATFMNTDSRCKTIQQPLRNYRNKVKLNLFHSASWINYNQLDRKPWVCNHGREFQSHKTTSWRTYSLYWGDRRPLHDS